MVAQEVVDGVVVGVEVEVDVEVVDDVVGVVVVGVDGVAVDVWEPVFQTLPTAEKPSLLS